MYIDTNILPWEITITQALWIKQCARKPMNWRSKRFILGASFSDIHSRSFTPRVSYLEVPSRSFILGASFLEVHSWSFILGASFSNLSNNLTISQEIPNKKMQVMQPLSDLSFTDAGVCNLRRLLPQTHVEDEGTRLNRQSMF